MRVSKFGSRAIGMIGMGLVFALAGFSFAINTELLPNSSNVSSRSVGSALPLRFANSNVLDAFGRVFSPTEYDLGDACLGSTLTRFVIVEGGIKPYRFRSVGSLSLANAISNTSSTLTLGLSGVLTGIAPQTIATNSRTVLGNPGLRFQVDVADANLTSRTGFFNLSLYDSKTTLFRFAVDNLPQARLDSPYAANIALLGGHTPTSVTTLSVTNAASGQAVKLSDLGLFLGTDGTLYGRPLAVGTFILSLRGTDASGAIARSRRNSNNSDQVFTLAVNDNPVTSSDTMTSACSVAGDTANPGGDKLSLKGLINAIGQDNTSLTNSDFQFQLGSISFEGRLDGKGKLVQKNADNSTVTVKVNAKTGVLTIAALRGTFIKGFDLTGIKDGDTVRRPIKIVVGSAVYSTEAIDFIARVSGTSYAFNFKQGSKGASASGGFQIVSVKGRDGSALTGQTGDAWRVGFVAQPRSGVTNPNGLAEKFGTITAVTVRIGTQFTQTFNGVIVSAGGSSVRVAGGPLDGVKSFAFNSARAKGTLTTQLLSTVSTGIPTAANALKVNNVFFPLGVDLKGQPANALFSGEHARRIFGFGTHYSDQPSNRLGSPFK